MHAILMLMITIGSYFLIHILVKNEKLNVFLKGLLVGVMLLGVIISIGSKPIKEADSVEVDQVEVDQVEIAEVENVIDAGLKIESLLEEIDFKFKSDNGRYWRIQEWDVKNDLVRGQIDRITNYIELGKFKTVRALLPNLHEQNNYVTEIKINYMVPVFMSENNYKDALRIVLEKMKFEKSTFEGDAKRFRFDMVYLLRYMYLNNGIEAATSLVDELKVEYPDSDLSYVWFTLSIKNFDDLYTKGYEDPFNKGSEKEHYLREFIKKNPQDKFIDHAYYYLGEYQEIIDHFPESDISSRAYYARANDLYHEMYHLMTDDGNYSWGEGHSYDKEALKQISNYFTAYFEDNAYGKMTYYGINKLTNIYNWHFRKTGDYSWHINLLEKMDEDSSQYDSHESNYYYGYSYYTMDRLMNSVASDLMYEMSSADHMVDWPETLQKRIDDFGRQDIVTTLKRGLANNAFTNDDLVAAKGYFDEAGDDYSYSGSYYYYRYYYGNRRSRLLNELTNVIGKTDKNSLLKIANRLKDNHEKTLAIQYYEKLEKMKLSDDELAQVYMYKAYCYRKLKRPEDMFLTHEYIAEHLKKTSLADDALAETGLYYLLYTEESQKARQIFEQVIVEYPKSNTVNDAYNWIAWSHLKDKNYREALYAYKELYEKFPNDKYGENALPNIQKIMDVYLKN